jgi:hypothetical protein
MSILVIKFQIYLISSGSEDVSPSLYSEMLLLAVKTPNVCKIFTSCQCQSFQLSFIDASTPLPILIHVIGYDMIYLLTAIGLTPGGSSTVHIYTKTINITK